MERKIITIKPAEKSIRPVIKVEASISSYKPKYIDMEFYGKKQNLWEKLTNKKVNNLVLNAISFVKEENGNKDQCIKAILDYLNSYGLKNFHIKESFKNAEIIETFLRYNISNPSFRKEVIEALDLYVGYVTEQIKETSEEISSKAAQLRTMMHIK